jgi:hypothetical protein
MKILYRLVLPLLYKNKQERKKNLKDKTTRIEKKYLERYLYVLSEDEPPLLPCPKVIWVCWLQGMDSAPDVVKKCYASLQRFCPDFEIKVVTLDNITEYVHFPDYIWKKYQKKQITNTEFSDLLRLALLSEHGGYWIDSTVFLTDALSMQIQEADFFAYHSDSHLKNNNWFLKASKGDVLIRNMKNLMFEYWKYENHLINYFLYHLFFDLMIEKSRYLAQKWGKVPLIYDDCYDLEYNFFTPYSDELWQSIQQKTSIHKLSYKYKKDKEIRGTFLEKLLGGRLD